MSKSLSLVQRESFFDDAFFKESWDDFDRAIQLVLDKFDTQGLKVDTGARSKTTDLYRSIRSHKIKDDLYASQALQVNEKDGKFQCVMDVKDFDPGNLSVRVVDDRVVVEGQYEKKSDDGSSVSSKSFYKEFTLPPAADIDQVGTALSRDGVLTIKAPKKEGDTAAAPGGALTSSSSSMSSSSSVQKSTTGSSSVSSSSSSKVVSSSSSFSSSSSSSVSTNKGFSGLSDIGSFDEMAKDMKDRLVFSHETVNLKLPASKE